MLLAVSTTIFLLMIGTEFFVGFNLIKSLSQQPIVPPERLPKISIILSALNEEKEIAATLASLLRLDYPHFEVIAIDDRSTDGTAQILDQMHEQDARLRVLHLQQLPPGWFGKNHALYVASQQAVGDWLLFTDADVMMKGDVLVKAMSYALNNQLDHVTLQECHTHQSIGLNMLLLGHYISYSLVMRPWRVRYAMSKKSLGHGAFNLVRKDAYKNCGGHAEIAMECLDDLKLGELLKRNGYKQDIVDGKDYVVRPWYTSLSDMIKGWEKNGFAFYDYRLAPLLRDVVFALLFFYTPVIGIFLCHGITRYLNLLNLFLLILLSAFVAKQYRLAKRYALLYPFSIGLLMYTVLHSTMAIYKNKGVVWRGTHYSLALLKNKKLQAALKR